MLIRSANVIFYFPLLFSLGPVLEDIPPSFNNSNEIWFRNTSYVFASESTAIWYVATIFQKVPVLSVKGVSRQLFFNISRFKGGI